MRKLLVLDTNLVVSAFLNPSGPAAQALDIGLAHFELACSKATFAELLDVLKRDKFDKYISKTDRLERAEAYAQSALFFDVPLEVSDCKDPKDNKFLALALTAQAVAIVTDDKRDLLVMNPFQGIEILGIRDFIAKHSQLIELFI